MSNLSEEEILKRLQTIPDDADVALSAPRLVKGAGRMTMEVLNEMEENWWNDAIAMYKDQYNFQNVADLDDLDRLLAMELLSMRYGYWLVSGKDYFGREFVEKSVSEQKDKLDSQIRQLKRHMGMDRKGRVESETESVGEYIKNLLRRAQEFGVHRDMQINMAFDLFVELRKLVGLHERTDEEEQAHLGITQNQIYEWIRDVAIPEFDKLDDAFRVNQRIWIKEVG